MSETEPIAAELYREHWRPSPSWASVVRPAWQALDGGAVGLAAADAWAQIAMMLGDTRAAPLCVFVCLHAAALLPPGVEHRRLEAHLHLALLDLGPAAAARFALELAAERTGVTAPASG